MTTEVRVGQCTDVGRVRQVNEDMLLVTDRLFAVADGVGGHSAGEVASLTAIESLRANFTEPSLDVLIQAVKAANHAVWEKASSQSDLRGMGTTLTALAIVEEEGEERLALVNVGDSRAYLLQHGELGRLTEDHSLVEDMVREGRLTPAEAAVHPHRSIITRALGLEPDVEVDHWQLLPYRGDRILLCSDGLTNEVSETRIASTLRRLADPDEAARDLVEQAKANGGSDNITVVVVDVVDDDDRAGQASEALGAEPPVTRSRDQTVLSAGTRTDEEDDAEPASRRPAREARAGRAEPGPRRFTWRVGVFLVALIAVLVGTALAVQWYATSTYFVGFQGDRVTVFKGRPGGLLWFDPEFQYSPNITRDQVPAARLDDLEKGHDVADLEEADAYIRNLQDEARSARGSGGNSGATGNSATTAPPTTEATGVSTIP